jgi:hypothetical protein
VRRQIRAFGPKSLEEPILRYPSNHLKGHEHAAGLLIFSENTEGSETGWRMIQFPVKQGINGEFRRFSALKCRWAEVEKGRLCKGFSANSLLSRTGNFKHRTGIFSAEQGVFREEQGTYRSRIFLQSSEVWVGEGSRPSRRLAGEGLITLQNDCQPMGQWPGASRSVAQLRAASRKPSPPR